MLNHSQNTSSFQGSLWRAGILALLPLGLLAASGPVQVEKTLQTTANPSVSVSNLSGKIVVRGWGKSQVHAVYIISSPQIEVDLETLPIQGAAQKVHFITHLVDPNASLGDETADYTLDIPAGSSLDIRNPQGNIRVEMIQGDTSIDSLGGTISVADVGGHLSVQTVGGDIDVIRAGGRVEASSINGNLHFINPASPMLRASTTSGNIVYEGDFVAGGEYILSDYSGNMDILCPPSASFELTAKTVRGKLENTFPLVTHRHFPSPLGSANSIFGTHNTGKATVELTSFSGTIRIHSQP